MTREPSAIAQRLGRENAESLIRIAGGTRVRVPNTLAQAKRLKAMIGFDLAVLVVLHFGGNVLAVPLSIDGAGGGRAVDSKRVARLTARGWSASRIARKLGCTERTVHSWRAKLRQRAGGNLGGNERNGS